MLNFLALLALPTAVGGNFSTETQDPLSLYVFSQIFNKNLKPLASVSFFSCEILSLWIGPVVDEIVRNSSIMRFHVTKRMYMRIYES